MPAKDLFHRAVKYALEKEGWTVTKYDYRLEYGGVEIYIDLVAERLITAEREGQKIEPTILNWRALNNG